jgi:hypothetical protein
VPRYDRKGRKLHSALAEKSRKNHVCVHGKKKGGENKGAAQDSAGARRRTSLRVKGRKEREREKADRKQQAFSGLGVRGDGFFPFFWEQKELQ